MTVDLVQPLRTSRLSLSQQAQEYLLGLIRDGAYQPGDQLPSQNELAAQLGISRPTLREALLNLEQIGIIIRRHGVGTFVALDYGRRLETGLERLESILELGRRQELPLSVNALQVQERLAGRELGEILKVSADTPMTTVERVIWVDDAPVAYMWDVAPASILSPSDVDDAFRGSVLDLLRLKQGLQVARAVADIIALNADAFIARRLRIKPGRAVLLLEEVLFDEQGGALEFSRNYFLPEFFRFHVVRR